MLPATLLIVGVLICAVSLWQVRQWIREAEAKVAAGPRRLEAIAEELIETAEVASAAVAEKTEELAAAIAMAERTADRLNAIISGSAGQAPAPVRPPARSAQPVRFRHARREIRTPAPAQSHAAHTTPPAAPAPVTAAAAGSAPKPAAPQSEPSPLAAIHPTAPEMHRRIWQMADTGQDVTTIARLLSITKGEVQTILGLRRLN